jgi:hypothetical protein
MNTTIASTNTILAIDLGKYKSVGIGGANSRNRCRQRGGLG